MKDLTDLANRMADEAGDVARRYFRTNFEIEHKSDESPVTIADKTIEKRLREIVEQERPDDGIIGEEFGSKESRNGYVWIFDPVDGTAPFSIGRPTFGTLIALWKDDKPVLGVIDQPILKERWVGVSGQQTTFNGAPVATRPCPEIKQAKISSTAPRMFEGPDANAFNRLEKESAYVIWGGDCYSYGLLASGWLDIVIEAQLGTYDYAALVPVIEGAGGMLTDWQGRPLTLESDGYVIALGDKRLWPEISKMLET